MCLRPHTCPINTSQGPRSPGAPGLPESASTARFGQHGSPAPGRPRVLTAGASAAVTAHDSDERYQRGHGLWHLKTTEKSRCTRGAAENPAAARRRRDPVTSGPAPRRPSGDRAQLPRAWKSNQRHQDSSASPRKSQPQLSLLPLVTITPAASVVSFEKMKKV